MTVSFHLGRYLVALLWHWITPFLFGAIAATVVTLVGLQESVQAIGNAFETAIANVAKQCAPQRSGQRHRCRTGQGPRSRLVGSRFTDPANGSTGGANP